MPNLNILAQTVPDIWRGPRISKVGHVTPFRPSLTEFFIFSLVPLVVNLHAKFEVSSTDHYRDMEGSQNFKVK